MNKRLTVAISVLLLSMFSSNLFGKIGIIVNKDLYSSIQSSITLYIEDLKTIEGKEVWLEKDNFDDNGTPQELQSALKDHYENDNLEGAVFIGDLAIARYNHEGDVFACDLYYMDMDGSWSTSGSAFSNHSGNTEAEIWISRIVCSVLSSYITSEADEVNKYFERVTKRMHGQDPQPRTYVIAGDYNSWSGLENENQGDMGYDPDDIETYRGSSCGGEWKNAIVAGKEYGFVYSHSSPTSHQIGFNLSGIYSNDVKCRFFNSFACSNADFERSNMCSAYATSNEGLVCVGSAKTGSMIMGSFRYYNRPLGEGDCFGEAFRKWFNDEGIDNIYWHYGMNLQGVGTLLLKPYASGPYLAISSPNGGEEWEQGSTYDIKWGSNVGGNVKIELLKGGSVDKVIESSTENDGLHSLAITIDYEVGDDYKIKISSLDNDTVLSESQDNFSITEEYIISVFPYVQDFDTLNTGTIILPYKWEQVDEDDINWTVWTGKTPSKEPDQGAATGPDGDNTSGSGNYIYVESSSPNNPDKKADYVTPKFNFKSLSTPLLTFCYHMFSDNDGQDEMGDLYIDISVDGNWNNDVWNIANNQGDEWHSHTVDLSTYYGDRVIFRFRAVTGSGWASDVCIDDFSIYDDPTGINDKNPAVLSYGIKIYGSRIYFQIPGNGATMQHVSMKLYNVQGKLVRTLLDGNVESGKHSLSLNKALGGKKSLAAGLYLCKMKVGEFTKTINLLLRK